MRNQLSNSLVDLADKYQNLLLLTGDHGYSLFDRYRELFPSRYLNCGIAEQNMVGMAAGLARTGFIPVVYGLSAFIPIRVLEQIKIDVCHDLLPVVFLGDGAGFVYSTLGTSHQSTEDIAAVRAIPNLDIYSPADSFEMKWAMNLALKNCKPSYIRIGKSDIGNIHLEELSCDHEKSMFMVRKGVSDIVFFATGSMVKTAIKIADHLKDISVYTIPRIKPFSDNLLLEALSEKKVVVCFEEHSIYGGLGGMIAELVTSYMPVKILRIGVKDRFSEKCGTYQYLLKEHGLDFAAVLNQVQNFLRC
jgi:transketolase